MVESLGEPHRVLRASVGAFQAPEAPLGEQKPPFTRAARAASSGELTGIRCRIVSASQAVCGCLASCVPQPFGARARTKYARTLLSLPCSCLWNGQ